MSEASTAGGDLSSLLERKSAGSIPHASCYWSPIHSLQAPKGVSSLRTLTGRALGPWAYSAISVQA